MSILKKELKISHKTNIAYYNIVNKTSIIRNNIIHYPNSTKE